MGWACATIGLHVIRIRVAVCLLDGDRLLLVEHLKAGRRRWLLPGGGVEPGETLVAAARRELLEETGLRVEVGRLLLLAESIEPGAGDGGRHLVHLVYAGTIIDGTLRAGRDGRLVDVAWHAVEAVPSLPMHPAIGEAVVACCHERLGGPIRVLGNVWQSDD